MKARQKHIGERGKKVREKCKTMDIEKGMKTNKKKKKEKGKN